MIARLQWEDWERLSRIGNVASKDAARPILTGISLEADEGRLRAVATDSYKLATVVVDAELDEGGPILLPARQVKIATSAFRQLARAQFDSKFAELHDAEVDLVDPPGEDPEVLLELSVGDRYVGSLTIDQILADGGPGFPKWRPLLRKPGNELAPSTLARKTREEVLEYVSLRYGPPWPEDSLKKDLLAYDAAKRDEPQPRTIALNAHYLTDMMKSTKGDWHAHPLRIEMFGEHRPVWFSNPADQDWQGIQMPVRA